MVARRLAYLRAQGLLPPEDVSPARKDSLQARIQSEDMRKQPNTSKSHSPVKKSSTSRMAVPRKGVKRGRGFTQEEQLRGASAGGQARASLPAKLLSAINRKSAQARWRKYREQQQKDKKQ
jgi:hypothetical protein